MKRIFTVAGVALIAGLCAFAWMRGQRVGDSHSSPLLETMPELSWLKTELDLSDSQFTRVSELHSAYLPECAEMCHQIAKAHERLDAAARGQTTITPDLSTAIEDHAKIHAACQEKMLKHLYETARLLNPDQAKQYLDVMLPYALDFSHSEPDDVHVK